MFRKRKLSTPGFSHTPHNPMRGDRSDLRQDGTTPFCVMMQIAEEDIYDDYVICRGYDTRTLKFVDYAAGDASNPGISVAKPYGWRRTGTYEIGEIYPALLPTQGNADFADFRQVIHTSPSPASVDWRLGQNPGVVVAGSAKAGGHPKTLNDKIEILRDHNGKVVNWLLIGAPCCSCIIDSDSFNREDAPTLGADWFEPNTPNRWSIESNTALSTGDGVAIFNTVHPKPSEAMVVYMDTVDEVQDSGAKWRLLVNVLDEDNYHYVEFERHGANDSILSLGIVSGGTDTVLKTALIEGLTGFTRKITAKIAENEFCGTVSNCVLSLVFVDPVIIEDGFQCGMESLAANMRVDNFFFEWHMDDKPECGNCLCNCQRLYMPPILNAHMTGTGRLAALNADVPLIWDRLAGRWQTGIVTPCGTWSLWFNCPSDFSDPNTANLVVDIGCNNSDGFFRSNRPPNSASCDPMEWVFGPYDVSTFDLVCFCGSGPGTPGTYTIVVTEA